MCLHAMKTKHCSQRVPIIAWSTLTSGLIETYALNSSPVSKT